MEQPSSRQQTARRGAQPGHQPNPLQRALEGLVGTVMGNVQQFQGNVQRSMRQLGQRAGEAAAAVQAQVAQGLEGLAGGPAAPLLAVSGRRTAGQGAWTGGALESGGEEQKARPTAALPTHPTWVPRPAPPRAALSRAVRLGAAGPAAWPRPAAAAVRPGVQPRGAQGAAVGRAGVHCGQRQERVCAGGGRGERASLGFLLVPWESSRLAAGCGCAPVFICPLPSVLHLWMFTQLVDAYCRTRRSWGSSS